MLDDRKQCKRELRDWRLGNSLPIYLITFFISPVVFFTDNRIHRSFGYYLRTCRKIFLVYRFTGGTQFIFSKRRVVNDPEKILHRNAGSASGRIN
jgi:hypothetical protein